MYDSQLQFVVMPNEKIPVLLFNLQLAINILRSIANYVSLCLITLNGGYF